VTDTTKIDPKTDTKPCEECESTEHTTLGHWDGGSPTPMTTNGHWDGGAPPKD
jgi:hypothetical protein